MSLNLSRISSNSAKKIKNKMKFTNYDLAYKVRSRVYELLISYDDNLNFEFEEE